MRRLFQFTFLIFFLTAGFSSSSFAKETVVLLHGIAKSSKDLKPIEEHLKRTGFNTLNITYPSQKKAIKDIAQHLQSTDLNKDFWTNESKVHFVTHSMGGLVARKYLSAFRKELPEDKLGRVVMIAPPNQGSTIADILHKLWPYKWFYGPAGQELTTMHQSKSTDVVYYDLGIIAGRKEWPYIAAQFVIKGKSDGRVSVAQTKHEKMTDHVIVNGTHTFIMDRDDVKKLIVNFLKSSRFEKNANASTRP